MTYDNDESKQISRFLITLLIDEKINPDSDLRKEGALEPGAS